MYKFISKLVPKSKQSDHESDRLWQENAEKYKCCCRSLHVKRVCFYIAYARLIFFIAILAITLICYFQKEAASSFSDRWLENLDDSQIEIVIFVLVSQLLIVVLLIYGLHTEKRWLLMPFFIFVLTAACINIIQLSNDIYELTLPSGSSCQKYGQILSRLIRTCIGLWCGSIIWRCIIFFGDKKTARRFGARLPATYVAFHYGDIPYGYIDNPQPPAYADTVYTTNKQPLR